MFVSPRNGEDTPEQCNVTVFGLTGARPTEHGDLQI